MLWIGVGHQTLEYRGYAHENGKYVEGVVLGQIRQPPYFTSGNTNNIQELLTNEINRLVHVDMEQLDKWCAAQANGIAQHRVKPEEYRQLDKHGQAALER